MFSFARCDVILHSLVAMGNGCSSGKNSVYSYREPYLSSANTKTKGSKKEKGKEKNERKSSETKKRTFKEAVKNSVDIDPCEEEGETATCKVKEVKVLPPIRSKPKTLTEIQYIPARVWGGSVSSYLDTIHRDSIIDEDIITGRTTNIIPKCL